MKEKIDKNNYQNKGEVKRKKACFINIKLQHVTFEFQILTNEKRKSFEKIIYVLTEIFKSEKKKHFLSLKVLWR